MPVTCNNCGTLISNKAFFEEVIEDGIARVVGVYCGECITKPQTNSKKRENKSSNSVQKPSNTKTTSNTRRRNTTVPKS